MNMSNQSDGWLTIREAALAWGVSELTIRRRIKDGRLPHRLEEGKYLVNPTAPATAPPQKRRDAASMVPEAAVTDDHPVVQNAAGRDSGDLAPLIPEMARLAQQAGKAALLEEQLRELERRYDGLNGAVTALATRNGWLESKLEERENAIKLLEDSQHRPSWWKRLFGSTGS